MPKSNGLYIAVAPLALLLIAGLGAHFLPILLRDNDKADEDDAPHLAYHAPKHTLKGMPTPTPMPNMPAKTQTAIEKTISGQIAAFHKNDFVAALTFSSPRFREMVTPDAFRDNVSRSYPQLLNATKQAFEPAHGNGTQAVIPVSVYAADGSVTKFLYMLNGTGGNWLIQGCAQLGLPTRTGAPPVRPGVVAPAGV